nr:hypothetical protein CFP56_56889 [Quercus suber]
MVHHQNCYSNSRNISAGVQVAAHRSHEARRRKKDTESSLRLSDDFSSLSSADNSAMMAQDQQHRHLRVSRPGPKASVPSWRVPQTHPGVIGAKISPVEMVRCWIQDVCSHAATTASKRSGHHFAAFSGGKRPREAFHERSVGPQHDELTSSVEMNRLQRRFAAPGNNGRCEKISNHADLDV